MRRTVGRLPVLECCGPAPHDDDCPVWLAIKVRLDAEWDETPIEGHRPVNVGPACCAKCGALWPCDTRRIADGTYVDEEPTCGPGCPQGCCS